MTASGAHTHILARSLTPCEVRNNQGGRPSRHGEGMPPSHLYKYKAVFKAAFVLRKPSAHTMDKTVSQLQLYQYFLGFFLPKGILDFFEPVWMETQSLDSRESKKDILYTGTKN